MLTRNDFASSGSPATAGRSQGADHHGSSELLPAGGSSSFEEGSPAAVEVGARVGAQKTGGAGTRRAATPGREMGAKTPGPGRSRAQPERSKQGVSEYEPESESGKPQRLQKILRTPDWARAGTARNTSSRAGSLSMARSSASSPRGSIPRARRSQWMANGSVSRRWSTLP